MSAVIKDGAPWLAPHRFKPGQSGNPAGAPKGIRRHFETRFLGDLYADWQGHGAEAIKQAREKDPVGYVKVAASLMPKQVENDSSLEEFNRDELRLAIDALRSFVALGQAGSARAEENSGVEASGLSTVPEATSLSPGG